MMDMVAALTLIASSKKTRKEFAHAWLLLSPTFAPYLTPKGLKEREELLRSLADANNKSPHNKGERAA